MVCSHCGLPGHTYRRCPTATEQQKKEIYDKIKAEKEAREQRRQQRQQRQQQQQIRQQQIRQQFLQQQQQQQYYNVIKKRYVLSNPMDYEVVLYWGLKNNDNLKRFGYCSSYSSYDFSCIKNEHRIVIIPFMEVQNGIDALKTVTLQSGGTDYFTVFDMNMEDFDGTDIIIDKDYKPPKTELDEWKECALKSKFLLDQIHKMTGGGKQEQFENIEPFLDMVQDISIPRTCTEIDKERAGVPSTFTNIT